MLLSSGIPPGALSWRPFTRASKTWRRDIARSGLLWEFGSLWKNPISEAASKARFAQWVAASTGAAERSPCRPLIRGWFENALANKEAN